MPSRLTGGSTELTKAISIFIALFAVLLVLWLLGRAASVFAPAAAANLTPFCSASARGCGGKVEIAAPLVVDVLQGAFAGFIGRMGFAGKQDLDRAA